MKKSLIYTLSVILIIGGLGVYFSRSKILWSPNQKSKISISVAAGNISIGSTPNKKASFQKNSGLGFSITNKKSSSFNMITANSESYLPEKNTYSSISLNAAAGNILADFEKIKLDHAKIQTAAGNIILGIPMDHTHEIELSTQAGNILLIMPLNEKIDAIRFFVPKMHNEKFDALENLEYVNGAYQTDGFETATNSSTIRITQQKGDIALQPRNSKEVE